MFVGLIQDPREFAGMSSSMITKKTALHPTGPVRGEVGRKKKVKWLMSRTEYFSSSLSFVIIHHFIFLSICIFPFSSTASPCLLISSEWSTSHCRSSERARSPRPAGCSCVSSAGAGSAAGPQSPSPPARPSWCPGWMCPQEAAGEQHWLTPWNLLLIVSQQICTQYIWMEQVHI